MILTCDITNLINVCFLPVIVTCVYPPAVAHYHEMIQGVLKDAGHYSLGPLNAVDPLVSVSNYYVATCHQ